MASIEITLLVVGIILYVMPGLFEIIILLKQHTGEKLPKLASYPMVSIVIPVRNEAHLIANCIDHIIESSYPKDKLELIIGDDASTDDTWNIINYYAEQHDFIRIIKIKPNDQVKNHKAWALHQLCACATGEFFFFTDADISVPKEWIQQMLMCFGPNTGIVCGVTVPKARNWWELIQQYDWIVAQGMIYFLNRLHRPTTAMGNNMCIPKYVYKEVGGDLELTDHLTEDRAIAMKIKKMGWGIVSCLSPSIKAITVAEPNLLALLSQRVRWSSDFNKFDLSAIILISIELLAPYFILLLFLNTPNVAIVILALKCLVEYLIYFIICNKIDHPMKVMSILCHQIWRLILPTMLVVFKIWHPKIYWKDRSC